MRVIKWNILTMHYCKLQDPNIIQDAIIVDACILILKFCIVLIINCINLVVIFTVLNSFKVILRGFSLDTDKLL